MFPEFRKHGKRAAATPGYHGSNLPKAGRGGENFADFSRMFEPVPVALPVGVVAHYLGQAQRAEHCAHSLHASSDRAGNIAWIQFLVRCKQFDDCECDRIIEQATKPRLPVAIRFHAASLPRFRIPETWKHAAPRQSYGISLRYVHSCLELRPSVVRIVTELPTNSVYPGRRPPSQMRRSGRKVTF